MARNQTAATYDRRVFTEGPSNNFRDDSDDSEVEIDPIQAQQLMNDPRFAAMFANNSNLYNLEFQGDDDEDQSDLDYIDINSLPNDQQQYFLQNDYNPDDSYRQMMGEDQGNVQFHEVEEYEEDEDSDSENDLIAVYQNGGIEADVTNYREIHLLGKGYSNQQQQENEEEEKFQCPETGAHFEFLDMISRLKKLQARRAIIDKVIQEEENKAMLLRQKEAQQQQLYLSDKTASSTTSEVPKRQNKSELREVANVVQGRNGAEVATASNFLQEQQVVQMKPKASRKKEAYEGQPLPTENNLLTEEGGQYGSFNFYGAGFHTQDQRKPVQTNQKHQSKQYRMCETQDDEISDIQKPISNKTNHTLRQVLVNNELISGSQNQAPVSYCNTEVRESSAVDRKGKGTKKPSLNNFFNDQNVNNSNRNFQRLTNIDTKAQREMEALALNKELLNRQIKDSAKNGGTSGSKRQTSSSNSKARNNSHGPGSLTIPQQNSRTTSIQKLLLGFQQNLESSKSRASANMYGHKSTTKVSTKNVKYPSGATGSNLVLGSGVNSSKNQYMMQPSQYTHQVYASIGSTLNKKPINTSKSGGLIARGNTLDNRQAQKGTNSSSHAAASHSTTVGVSSYNGSRPGSAIKKKVGGLSPTNNIKAQKMNFMQPEFKNLLFYNSKQEKKPSNIVVVNQSKTKEVAAHKKTSSMQVKSSSRSKTKNLGGAVQVDQNSLALEQILQQQLETQGDYHYSTFHEGQDGNIPRRTQPLIGSSSSQKQKSMSKGVIPQSRQKADITKYQVGTKTLNQPSNNPDLIKFDINSIIKKISMKQSTQVKPAYASKTKQVSSHQPTQQTSISQGLIPGSFIQGMKQVNSRVLADNKRYSSIKTQEREHQQIQRNRSKDSRSRGSTKQSRIHSGMQNSGVPTNYQQHPHTLLTGSSYDMRSERCETVS